MVDVIGGGDNGTDMLMGRLNIFQKSMLEWNDLHPYNAVHVVRIPAELEFERLKSVITATLEREGLTGLTLHRRAGTYQYEGGPASAEIRLIATDPADSAGFAQEIEHQLNTPFTQKERFSPFRFFVVPEPGSFSLGMAYFHAMADAECVIMLLKEIVDAYRSKGILDSAPPVDRYPLRRDNLLRHDPGVLARKLASFPSLVRHLRSACRPHYRDPGNFNNKFIFFTLSSQLLNEMLQAAKSFGVTLNDLFLAILMKAIALLTPDRTRKARRRGISLGCIVNIRKDLGLSARNAFGLFLGSFVVHHEVPADISLADLARDIGRQTLRIKRARLYLGAPLELALGRLLISLFSPQRQKKLFQKHFPLWGGLTNMNLNPLWPQPWESRPIDYFRVVSTGPLTPLVLSITTIGSVANIGLSYRSTVFLPEEIDRVKNHFMEHLEQVQAAA